MLHFTDPHLGLSLSEVPLRDWLGKRIVGGANLLRGRGKRFADAPAKIVALAEFARAEVADAVICTGDLTALGTNAELAVARAEVEPFFEAPLGFVCLPGNHDLYTRSVVSEQRFESQFADGIATDMPEIRTDGPWPLVRLFGDEAAVIGVNSARPNLPWQSSGRVPDIQLIGLRAVLERPELRERFLFVATHYAPLRDDGSPDTPQHGLENADEFLRATSPVTSGAILCGHIHHAFHYASREQGLDAPDVFCGGSATMEGHEAAWWFEIDAEGASVRKVNWDGASWTLTASVAARLPGS
ncbi:MAG: metallophosphoesterase [marine benthic group bacterium]|nr:metallophosphoesterase [Gemmatimonadota bacterium]